MDKAFFSDTPHIQYGETDMEPLVRNACRFGCDIQIVCTRGTAEISTGIQSYGMRRGTELFLFGGTLVQVSDPSPDFTVRMLLYPKDVVIKAILPIDSDFLNYLHEYPFLDHIGGGAPEDEWENVLQWMDMARLLFTRPVQYFRKQIEQNFLQSMLMCLYNHIPRKKVQPHSPQEGDCLPRDQSQAGALPSVHASDQGEQRPGASGAFLR